MKFYNNVFEEYDAEMIKKFTADKKIVFFCASTRNEKVIKEYFSDKKIEYICDNDSNKWGKEFLGIKIVSPETLRKENLNNIVVITVIIIDYYNLRIQFESLGLLHYFFYGDVSKMPVKGSFIHFSRRYLDVFCKEKRFLLQNNAIKDNIKYKNQRFEYVHFFPDSIFLNNFIRFIKDKFDFQKHLFVVYKIDVRNNVKNKADKFNTWDFISKEDNCNIFVVEETMNLNYLNIQEELSSLDTVMNECKNIIFHSGGLTKEIVKYFKNKLDLLEEKATWKVWGMEARYNKEDEKQKDIINILRHIKNMDCGGDREYEYILKEYDMIFKDNKKIKSSYNYISEDILEKCKDKKHDNECINILLNHSASLSGMHKDGLDALSKFKNEKIKIYCVLSYGNEQYAKEIKEYGENIFGEKFIPIFKIMNTNEYIEFLSNIDIAVMCFENNMAANNIRILLYLGKKVYIKRVYGIWDFYEKMNFIMNDFSNIKNEDFEDFIINDLKAKENNFLNVKDIFNIDMNKELWNKLFNLNLKCLDDR